MNNYRKFAGLLRDKETLNPIIFDQNQRIHETIREFMIERARHFVKALGLKSKNAIEDVRLTGGNASYTYTANSDLDVTIMLNRELNLSTQEVRRLGIACSLLNYKLNPKIGDIDLNFFISSKNVGGTRPANQAIYSLFQNKFIKKPSRHHESHANHIASKANYFAEIIENCLLDETDPDSKCALALLQRLKAFRAKGLASKAGEFSTANAVWRVLSRSGYIAKVKEKVNQLKTDFYKMKVKKPSMLTNDDYRLFVNTVPGINTIPTSIVTWNKRIMKGGNPEAFIKRVSPFLELFDDKFDGTN